MFMICIICGIPTKNRYDTTTVCDKCMPGYLKRVEMNLDALHLRRSVEEIQRAT